MPEGTTQIWRGVLAKWMRRYGWQEAAATAVLLVWCALFGGRIGENDLDGTWFGVGAGLLEITTYYGVAWVRHRRLALASGRPAPDFDELLNEYGPAELLDLFLRPLLMGLGAGWSVPGVLAGSFLADGVFYRVAWFGARAIEDGSTGPSREPRAREPRAMRVEPATTTILRR